MTVSPENHDSRSCPAGRGFGGNGVERAERRGQRQRRDPAACVAGDRRSGLYAGQHVARSLISRKRPEAAEYADPAVISPSMAAQGFAPPDRTAVRTADPAAGRARSGCDPPCAARPPAADPHGRGRGQGRDRLEGDRRHRRLYRRHARRRCAAAVERHRLADGRHGRHVPRSPRRAVRLAERAELWEREAKTRLDRLVDSRRRPAGLKRPPGAAGLQQHRGHDRRGAARPGS